MKLAFQLFFDIVQKSLYGFLRYLGGPVSGFGGVGGRLLKGETDRLGVALAPPSNKNNIRPYMCFENFS